MKNKTFIFGLVILSFFCNSGFVRAQQENRVPSISVNESAILVEFKTETDPPQSSNQFVDARGTTHIKGGRQITHRIFVDQTTGANFGYDLEVQPSSVANHFMLTIKPLSVEKLNIKSLPVKAASIAPVTVRGLPVDQFPVETKERIAQKATNVAGRVSATTISGQNVTLVPDKNKIENAAPIIAGNPTKYPPAFLIEDGGSFALDVLVNPQTGVKIVDIIKISSEPKRVTDKGAKLQQPLDFTPDRGELSVNNFRFLINEQTVLGADSPKRGGVAGAIIWIFLPGQGRFIFSLIPHKGYDFQNIGTIQGNKISFRIGNDRYEWVSATPVFNEAGLSGGERDSRNLWVLHEPDYSSQNESTTPGGYLIGAADRIEYLLKKK